MTVLDYGDLLALTQRTMAPMQANTAAAVALASSGGNPDAPGGLFGLGASGSAETDALMASTRTKSGQDWSGVPAYDSGAYKAYTGASGIFGGTGSSIYGSTLADDANKVVLPETSPQQSVGTPSNTAINVVSGAAPPPNLQAIADAPVPKADDNCLIGWPSFRVNAPGPIPGGVSIPGVCFFRKSWGFAIVGSLALVAGGLVMLYGLGILTKVDQKVAQMASFAGKVVA